MPGTLVDEQDLHDVEADKFRQSTTPMLTSLSDQMTQAEDSFRGMLDDASHHVARSVASLGQQAPSVGKLEDWTSAWAPKKPDTSAALPPVEAFTSKWTQPAAAAPSGTPSAMPTSSSYGPPAGMGSGTIQGASRPERINSARQFADAAEARTGVPADVNLAFAVHESGLEDQYGPGMSYHGRHAVEGEDGTPITDWGYDAQGNRVDYPTKLKSYQTANGSFDDFADLISGSSRYQPALQRYKQTGDRDQLIRDIWAAGYGESKSGPDETVNIRQNQTAGGQAVSPNAPATAASSPPQPSAGAPPSSGGWEVDQAALDDADKWALCGPVAAVMAATKRGGQWTVAQAKQIAQGSNLWDAGQGMHGLGTEVDLLNRMGVSARTGAADEQSLAADAQAGNTPIISTNRHYFILKGYDPSTGKFDTTTSGGVLTGGSRYLTLQEISNLGGGIQGAAYMDNPASPTPSSVAAGDSQKTLGADVPDSGMSAGDQKRSKLAAQRGEAWSPQSSETTGSNPTVGRASSSPSLSPDQTPMDSTQPSPLMMRQPLGAPTQGDTATGQEYDPRDADQGRHELPDGTSGGTSGGTLPDPSQYGAAQDDPGQAPGSPYTVVPSTAPMVGDRDASIEMQTAQRPGSQYAYQPAGTPLESDSDPANLTEMGVQATPRVMASDQPIQSDQGQMREMQVAPRGGQPVAYGASGDDPGTAPTPPRIVQAGMPSINLPDLTPVYDAGGKLLSYIHHGADQIKDGASSLVEGAKGVASAVDSYLPAPAGGLPETGARIRQIQDQAAADQGLTGDVRAMFTAADDPQWRAQNPDLAQEYDDLQGQYTLSVGGNVGAGGDQPFIRAKQTVEKLQQRLTQARNIVDRLIHSGDPERLALAQENAAGIESDLIDAVNKRRGLEPRIRSDVGTKETDLPLSEGRSDALNEAMRPQEGARTAPEDLSGPVSIPTDTGSRLNVAAGPSAGSQIATTAGNAIRGAMAGGLTAGLTDPGSPQGEDESDADYAARRAREVIQRVGTGALIGGAGFAAAGRVLPRGAGGALQMVGPQGQGPSPVPGFNRGQANRLNNAMVQAQNAKPANVLEVAQAYRNSFGLLGNFAGGIVNALGGPVEMAFGLPTEAIRTGIIKGYPAPVIYQGASIAAALKDAAVSGMETALGRISPAARAAPDFRPPLYERMGDNPVAKAAGYVIDTPGRVISQAPDAFWSTVFDRWGRARTATEIMTEKGVSRLDPQAQVQELNRLLSNPTPQEAQRIADGAKAFAEENTYKGKAGYVEQTLGSIFRPGNRTTTTADPAAAQIHDLVGSFLMPFYSSLFKINKLAATRVPGVGMLANRELPMSEKVARQAVGLGFGVWAADRAAQGLVTGAGPDDPDEKAALVTKGWAPYSTYVPGIGYVPSNDFGSAGPILKAIGGHYDAQRYATPAQKADAIKQGDATVKGILRSVEDFPVVQAMESVMKMVKSPIEGAADLGVNVASQFVPALVRAAAASGDPYARRVDPNASPIEQIGQKAVNRVGFVPGLGERRDLPPVLDRKGEPVPNPRAGMGAFLPRATQEQPADPITKEMGTYGVNLDTARQQFTFTRAGADAPDGAPGTVPVPLSTDMQQKWLRYRWQNLQEQAPAIQGDPRYVQANDPKRQDVWKNAVRAAEQYADRALKTEIGRPALEEMIRGAPAPPPVRRAS